MNNYYYLHQPSSVQLKIHCSPLLRKIQKRKPSQMSRQDSILSTQNILIIAKGINLTQDCTRQSQRPNYFNGQKSIKFPQHVQRQQTQQQTKKNYQFRELSFDNSTYTFSIGFGNNSELLLKIMKTRQPWVESSPINSIFNFKWNQTDQGFNYNRLKPKSGVIQVFNHFPNHRAISEKANLILNLSLYAEYRKFFIFDVTPLTFHIDLNKENAELQFAKFLCFFSEQPRLWKNRFRQFINNPNQEKYSKQTSLYTQPQMANTFGDKQIWIFKTSDLNRGRGIQLFDTLEQLEKILLEETNQNKSNCHEFVIQKYIEKPFLINNRKFDIRVWVLITHTFSVYVFSEGYLRTSTEQFNLNNLQNQMVHLTNNAVQKNASNYGQYEEGNQLSFSQFEQILEDVGKGEVFCDEIWPEIKRFICLTILSVRKQLLEKEYKYCFEIFGYDFIIDEQLKVWLIEVNTNPCLEESSSLLSMLLPRMINDAFKLTIDKVIKLNFIFWVDISKKVNGYEDNKNMWELLLNLQKTS